MKKRATVFIILLFCLIFNTYGSNNKVKLAVTIPVETTLGNCSVDSALNIWTEMIKESKETIDFGEFYITNENGKNLEKIIVELKKAGERGVKIRFLTDKKMIKNSKDSLEMLKEIKGLEISIFDWKNLTGGVLHAKYFIVDNKKCFIGSQNFDWRSLTHIHETGVLINDENVSKCLSAIFESDWNFSNGVTSAYDKLRSLSFENSDKYYLTGSPEKFLPKGVKFSLKTLIDLIDNSKKNITIQLLNYSTKIYGKKQKFDLISNSLKNAAKRGVKIKILVSDWNKKKPGIYDLFDLSKVDGIELKFITIPISKNGFIPYARVIHSKVMRVDDNICMIGTSNWAEGYFMSSRNFEFVVKDKDIANKLDCLFRGLWDSSYGDKIEDGKSYKVPKVY